MAAARTSNATFDQSLADKTFKEELDDLANGRDWIEILYTVSVTSRDVAWPHRIGRIDLALLKDIETRHPGAIHYLAGPAPFVDALSGALLVELGVDRGQILAEVFRGYDTEPALRSDACLVSWKHNSPKRNTAILCAKLAPNRFGGTLAGKMRPGYVHDGLQASLYKYLELNWLWNVDRAGNCKQS